MIDFSKRKPLYLISDVKKKFYIFFDNIAIRFAAKVVTVSKTIEDDLVETQRINRSKTLLCGFRNFPTQ